MCIYIYIHREREKERDYRERDIYREREKDIIADMYIYIYVYMYREREIEREREIRCMFTATNLRTKILEFRGLDSSRILMLRGEILGSIGNFPGNLSQQILVGILLVGRLGAALVLSSNALSELSRLAPRCSHGVVIIIIITIISFIISSNSSSSSSSSGSSSSSSIIISICNY